MKKEKEIKNLSASVRARLTNYKTNSDQQELWRGFLNTIKVERAPANLSEVAKLIETFLEKPIMALVLKKSFDGKWKAPGPWH